jgi:hypothetical protein
MVFMSNRGLLELALVAGIAGIFSAVTLAAPISGNFTLDLVIAPQCDDLIPDNTSICDKIDDTIVKVEADLILTLSVSGLDITSTTVFTFKGLESQAFVVAGTVGAMTFRDTFVFSSDLVEIEFVRTSSTLSVRYCINYSTPGTAGIGGVFFTCPTPDSLLYFYLEDVGVFHPAVANLALAQIFDADGMLDAPLELCKKIVDLSLNIAGLTLATRGLFANFNCGQDLETARTWETGIVLVLEGCACNISGVTWRSETWIGARQGLECWGECKPLERNYGGKVVPDFTFQEEKIFIRNLVFSGITNNFRLEFKFGPGDFGLTYVEWNSRYELQPFGLSINNTLRMDGLLNALFNILITSYRFGGMSVTAIFYCYLSIVNTWEAQLAEFVTTFDPPGVTVTSDLVLCTERLFIGLCQSGVLQHNIYVSATVGSLTVDLRVILFALISDFQELWAAVGWKVGSVSFKTSLIVAQDSVLALAFGIGFKF